MSVFERNRVNRAQNPKHSETNSFITGGAAAFSITSQDSFTGDILALVANDTFIVQRGMSDKTTCISGIAAFTITVSRSSCSIELGQA